MPVRLDDGTWVAAEDGVAAVFVVAIGALGTFKKEGFAVTADLNVGGERGFEIGCELRINRHDVAFFRKATEIFDGRTDGWIAQRGKAWREIHRAQWKIVAE